MVGRADKGLIITTGTFTPEARREATRDGAPAIDLIDGDALCELMKSLKIGVTVRLVEEVDVEVAHFAISDATPFHRGSTTKRTRLKC